MFLLWEPTKTLNWDTENLLFLHFCVCFLVFGSEQYANFLVDIINNSGLTLSLTGGRELVAPLKSTTVTVDNRLFRFFPNTDSVPTKISQWAHGVATMLIG